MKYHDNMTSKEARALLRELAMIDNAYKRCQEVERQFEALEAVDQVDELRRAALNHRGQP